MWNQKFQFYVTEKDETLLLQIWDRDDMDDDDIMSEWSVSISEVLGGWSIDDWLDLQTPEGLDHAPGRLRLRLGSSPSPSDSREVPDAHFPLRHGCRVTLFQDAHTEGEPKVRVQEDLAFLPATGCTRLRVDLPDDRISGEYLLQAGVQHVGKLVWLNEEKGVYLYGEAAEQPIWSLHAELGGDIAGRMAYVTGHRAVHCHTPLNALIYGSCYGVPPEEEAKWRVELAAYEAVTLSSPDDRIAGVYALQPETHNGKAVWFLAAKGVYLYADSEGCPDGVWDLAPTLGAQSAGRYAYCAPPGGAVVHPHTPVGTFVYGAVCGGPPEEDGKHTLGFSEHCPPDLGDYAKRPHTDSEFEYQLADNHVPRGPGYTHVPRNLWEETYIAIAQASPHPHSPHIARAGVLEKGLSSLAPWFWSFGFGQFSQILLAGMALPVCYPTVPPICNWPPQCKGKRVKNGSKRVKRSANGGYKMGQNSVKDPFQTFQNLFFGLLDPK